MASLTLRVLLCAVLAWSTATKLSPAGFRALRAMVGQLGVRRYPALAGLVLVGAEATTATLLAVPTTVHIGSLGAVVLFAGLTGGVAVVLRRRMSVRCACFGGGAARLGPVHLIRNGALLACATACAAAPVNPLDASGQIVCVCLGALLALITIRLDDLSFLFTTPAKH